MRLSDVASRLASRVTGEGALEVERLVHPDDACGVRDLAVALDKESAAALPRTRAGAALIAPGAERPERLAAIEFAGDLRAALAELTPLFDRGPAAEPGVHPSAVVAPDAVLGAGVSVGPCAVIGPRSRIGAGATILAHVTLGAEVVVGEGCRLHPGVRVGDRVRLGARVIVHGNAVIGADGFSFLPARLRDGTVLGPHPRRIHSLGTVEIGDDVEIGAGATIDRGTLRATRIGAHTKIDNLVQVGHNVSIGESVIVCGMVGLSGSVAVGDRVLIGGGAGVADHVVVEPDSAIGAGSGVLHRVRSGTTVTGSPAQPIDRHGEQIGYVMRLKSLNARVAEIEKRLGALAARNDSPS
jgi:UDP-3-O-[3-hydroxymyristoyl] glucosamine N-acyltransferase